MEGLFIDGLTSLPGFNLIFGGSGGGGGGGGSGGGSDDARKPKAAAKAAANSVKHLDIVRMYPRIFAVGKPWDRRTEKEAHRNNAAELGRAFERRYRRRYLMINLSGGSSGHACAGGLGLTPSKNAGPSTPGMSLGTRVDYHRLRYQVLECDLESRPTLETLFRLCHAVQLWLDLDPQNVIAVFCKNGVHTCRLFLSAYAVFDGKAPSTEKALADFYYKRVRVNYEAQYILIRAQPSLRHFLGQFQETFRNDGVPHTRPVVIFMLLLEHLPRITAKGLMETSIFNFFGPSADEVDRTAQPIIRIYQGQGNGARALVYSSLSDPESCVQWDPAAGKLRLKCNVQIVGDAEIDCVFPGNTNKHLFRYFCHSAFLKEDGLAAVSRNDIHTSNKQVFAENFKLELVVHPGDPTRGKSNDSRSLGRTEDPFRYLRKRVSKDAALDVLADLHFLNPDPKLTRELVAAGHPERDVRFALQRANNTLHGARALLASTSSHSGGHSRPAMDDDDPIRDDETAPSRLSANASGLRAVVAQPAAGGPRPASGSMPFIRDEDMTSELETMLERLKSPAPPALRKSAAARMVASKAPPELCQGAKALTAESAPPVDAPMAESPTNAISSAAGLEATEREALVLSNNSEALVSSNNSEALVSSNSEALASSKSAQQKTSSPMPPQVPNEKVGLVAGDPQEAVLATPKEKRAALTKARPAVVEEELPVAAATAETGELKAEDARTAGDARQVVLAMLKRRAGPDVVKEPTLSVTDLPAREIPGKIEPEAMDSKQISLPAAAAAAAAAEDPRQAVLAMLKKRACPDVAEEPTLTVKEEHARETSDKIEPGAMDSKKASLSTPAAEDPRQAILAMLKKRAGPDVVKEPKDEHARKLPGEIESEAMDDKKASVPPAEVAAAADPRQAMLAMLQKRAAPDSTSTAPQTEAETGPRQDEQNTGADVAKFKRMLAVGVPEGAVRAKMMQEKADPTLLFGKDASSTPSSTTPSRGPPPPEYEKFVKMLKMGVPEGAVETKMRIEKLDPSWIGIGASNDAAAAGGGGGVKKAAKDSIRRKKFHWEAIPENRLKQNSIWTVSRSVAKFRRGAAQARSKLKVDADVDTKDTESGLLDEDEHDGAKDRAQRSRRGSLESIATSEGGLLSPSRVILDELDPDMKELESLFTQRPGVTSSTAGAPSATSTRPAVKPKAPSRVVLLDMKRSQNVSIGLKRIKLSGEEICAALNAFDGEMLTLERLQVMQSAQMLPTQEEEKIVGGYRGEISKLGEAEQFFRALVDAVEWPKIRVDAMLFRAEFEERLQELIARVDLVRRACKMVRKSESLQKVFQVVLLVGNKINAEGAATIQGFTVASLLKLSQTKSFNRKTTILDFIAQFAAKRIPEVLSVDQELELLGEAKRLQFAIFDAEESGLHMGYQTVMRAIKQAERDEDGAAHAGAAHRGLESLCSFSTHVQAALTSLEASLEAMRSEYASLLEFFCEEDDLPVQDFFSTLDTFLKSFGTAARTFQEKQRRQAARARAERQRRTLRRSESLGGAVLTGKSAAAGLLETPKSKSYRDPKSRYGASEADAIQATKSAYAAVSLDVKAKQGADSEANFRTPPSRRVENGENFAGNEARTEPPQSRSRPLSQTPSLSRFLAEI